jgi:hypothetical protein
MMGADRMNIFEVNKMIKKLLIVMAAMTCATVALAQAEPAAKESGRAIAESSKQAGDNARAAVSSEPDKSVYKAKARGHKARAHMHRHRAKEAADSAVH